MENKWIIYGNIINIVLVVFFIIGLLNYMLKDDNPTLKEFFKNSLRVQLLILNNIFLVTVYILEYCFKNT